MRWMACVMAMVVLLGGCTGPERAAAPDGWNPEEPWDVVYISDSSGMFVAEAYGQRIRDDVGVEVRVHDLWSGGLSARSVLEAISGEGPFAADAGDFDLPTLVADAEVIVLYANPTRSESAEHPWDWECPVRQVAAWSCAAPTACGPDTWEQYEADLSATLETILEIRGGEPVVLRMVTPYLPWGPLESWRDCGLGSECTDCWIEYAAAIQRVADDHGVPVADVLRHFSGPDVDQDMPKELIADDVHPLPKTSAMIADVLADLGYEPVSP